MEYIPVIIFVVAMLVLVGMGINKLAEKVSENPKRLLVAVVVALFVFVFLGSLAYAEESEWQGATVNGSVEVTLDEETVYIVVFTTDDGNVLSYFDDASVTKGTHLKVKISPYGETLDVEVEEPEPIWFLPFCFIGTLVAPVASKSKKYKLAQTMPPDLYLPCKVWEIQVSIVYYINNSRSFNTVAMEPTIVKALKSNKAQDVAKAYWEIIGKALNLLDRATTKEIPAYIVAYVPEYKQMAVIACNYVGFLEYWRNTAISDKISTANALLRKGFQIIPGSAEHKPANKPIIHRTPAIISDKDNPVKMIVRVKYSKGSKEYTFRCRSAHFKGDFVTVEYHNGEAVEYKNTEVTYVGTMHQSELNALAKKLGYKEIAELYCERAIDTPEAWKEWGGKDPRVQINPEDDPELYAPSAEEIEEFEAMRSNTLGSGYRDF